MLLYSCCIRLMQILDVQIQTDEFRWLHKVCRWDLKRSNAVATAEPSLFLDFAHNLFKDLSSKLSGQQMRPAGLSG